MSVETTASPAQPSRIGTAKKGLTYLLFFSIVMFFAGLTSAYLVSKGGATYWVHIRMPAPFWWSTAFILVSSATMHMALLQARKDRKRAVAPWVLFTLGLGLCFTVSQFKGWGDLWDNGLALVGRLKSVEAEYGKDYTIERRGQTLVLHGGEYFLPEDTAFEHSLNAEMAETSNAASSYFYVLTLAHFAHIIGGLIALVVIAVKAALGRYGAADHQGLWAGTVFWHFLAAVWVYLLLFLVFVH